MSYDDVVQKFMKLATPVVGETQARQIEQAVRDLPAQPHVGDVIDAMKVR
jgi:hypothetical protein